MYFTGQKFALDTLIIHVLWTTVNIILLIYQAFLYMKPQRETQILLLWLILNLVSPCHEIIDIVHSQLHLELIYPAQNVETPTIIGDLKFISGLHCTCK